MNNNKYKNFKEKDNKQNNNSNLLQKINNKKIRMVNKSNNNNLISDKMKIAYKISNILVIKTFNILIKCYNFIFFFLLNCIIFFKFLIIFKYNLHPYIISRYIYIINK